MDPGTITAFSDELEKLSNAGVSALVRNPIIVGAVIGALGAGGAHYAYAKPSKGEKSRQQMDYSKREQNIVLEEKVRKKEGRKPSFASEVSRITAKPMRELADLAAKYPGRSSVPVAVVGAQAGAAIARAISK